MHGHVNFESLSTRRLAGFDMRRISSMKWPSHTRAVAPPYLPIRNEFGKRNSCLIPEMQGPSTADSSGARGNTSSLFFFFGLMSLYHHHHSQDLTSQTLFFLTTPTPCAPLRSRDQENQARFASSWYITYAQPCPPPRLSAAAVRRWAVAVDSGGGGKRRESDGEKMDGGGQRCWAGGMGVQCCSGMRDKHARQCVAGLTAAKNTTVSHGAS
jgi:hypothetical protein